MRVLCNMLEIIDRRPYVQRMEPIIVRQCLPKDKIEHLAQKARAWYAKLPQIEHPQRERWLNGGGVTLPNYSEMYEIFDLFKGSEAALILQSHLGESLAVPYDHALMRWRGPHVEKQRLRWHRDRDAISEFFPMNIWIPLTLVDRDAMGLAFEVDGKVIEPEFTPGDVVVFNRDTLHGPQANKLKDRISIEFRVGASLEDNVGIVLA
jgi:ectoine hydroxylase-related dioxygenase (phytanoyl-CoA dioxygenase family)